MGAVNHLACSTCGSTFEASNLGFQCHCGGWLSVNYDLSQLQSTWSKGTLNDSRGDLWRYEPVLPAGRSEAVTLIEGWTPLIKADRLAAVLNAKGVWIKDEGRNPTNSFEARGMSVAVTMGKKFGFQKLAITSAGDAGGALAAYAALAGLEAHVVMPSNAPQANFLECKGYGAQVTLVNGLLGDCDRLVSEMKERNGWLDVSTLKEPYRVEGTKTMGYEIAEQFGWVFPDAIVCPCGGGMGVLGMWKAFGELKQLGWVSGKLPRMIAVQATGCQPIVEAFTNGAETASEWTNPYTVAGELRVPKPLGSAEILKVLRESQGTAMAVSDEEMIDGAILLGEQEGVSASLEGGAAVAALPRLFASGTLHPDERIVVHNTGSALKCLRGFSARFARRMSGEQDKLGGLITPR